ncbi:putative glycoprotein 3-alpha-L-fucosyltransferase A-like [Capsicum annuum]|nr:putative glycoprotein 3-alpha-L-fucosyltransferase A-like [Capsicum annuum]
MEETHRKVIPAAESCASSESCGNELTRLSSGSSSLSVANSKGIMLLQSGNSTTGRKENKKDHREDQGESIICSIILYAIVARKEAQAYPVMCPDTTCLLLFPFRSCEMQDKYTGWTNEKHNTFLDHLEASFVKQLHRSMALRAGSVEMNQSCRNLSEELSSHVNKASEQLTFPHHGCWKKIKTVRKPPVVYIAADSHDCQFCFELHRKGKRTRDEKPTDGLKTKSHLISELGELQNTVCTLTEGSGQNFIGEDFDENSRCKKMKTVSVDTTDQEQVIEPPTTLGACRVLNGDAGIEYGSGTRNGLAHGF